MTKIRVSDETRKAYPQLKSHIENTFFDAFFQKHSPREVVSTVESTLILVNIEQEVNKGEMSLRRISAMFSELQMLMRTFSELHTAIFLPDFSHNADVSYHVQVLTDFNSSTLVVALDDLMQFAAIEGGWSESFYHCLSSLKRIYWQLSLQEKNGNEELAACLAT